METLLIIIAVIFGVLQSILFFKLWGMTNDVKNIYSSMTNLNWSLHDAKIAYIQGNIEATKFILDKSLIDGLKHAAFEDSGMSPYQNVYENTRKKYTKYYTDFGLELPDFDKFKDPKSFQLDYLNSQQAFQRE